MVAEPPPRADLGQGEPEHLLRARRPDRTLWWHLQRYSATLLYYTLMRGGGEPFGPPYEKGMPSLTSRVVGLLKQRGFFTFETLERLPRRRFRNKFTRHGAAPFRGDYLSGTEAEALPARAAAPSSLDRIVHRLLGRPAAAKKPPPGGSRL